MRTRFTERTHSTTLKVRPELAEGRSDVNRLSEFDPHTNCEFSFGYKSIGVGVNSRKQGAIQKQIHLCRAEASALHK